MNNAMKSLMAAAVCGAAWVGGTQAAPIIVQPDESTSLDVAVYEFAFASSIDLNADDWGKLLAATKTETGHDMVSLIQFDLSGVTLAPGESASLNLYVGNVETTVGLGVNPTSEYPGTLDLYANTAAWDETTKWANKPSYNTTAVDSLVVEGINQWISFDITDQLQAWLDTPSSNFGFTLVQRDLVLNEGKVALVFDSSAGVNKPSLQVVPEPTTLTMIAGGAVMLLRRRRD